MSRLTRFFIGRRPPLLAAAGIALLVIPSVGCEPRTTPETAPENAPETAMGAGANWPNTGGATDESGYSRLDEINTSNVGRMGLVSSLDLEGEITLEATPLAVDGVLYFTGTYAAVYAVEAKTGKLLWKYDPELWEVSPQKMLYSFAVNRGAAYANGRIFAAALDGRLFALVAKTGELLWSVETLPEDTAHTSTGAPRVFKDKVIIGNGGADIGVRGFVTAYDQATGELVWRFYTVPGSPEQNAGDPVMEMAAKTWSGEWWKMGGGGTVWNGITYDQELNHVYLGVGNGGPWDPELRSPGGGDNLFVSSIVALDADTGEYIWHYQQNPREAWDYKATANMIMTTLSIDGEPLKVLMQASSNGFYYVLDRETGKLLSAEKIGKVTWAERIDLETGRPVEAEGVRYESGEAEVWPSGIGAHNWHAMSFSPKTGLAYIPYMQIGSRFFKDKDVPGETRLYNLTIQQFISDDPQDGKGALLAWDPVEQKPRWRVQHDTLWNGGALSTAGGLVFQGTADGYFSAYDAASGERLWRFNVGHGVISAPISYSVDGKQYVSVLSGYGGVTGSFSKFMNVGWKYGAQPRRVLTFALDGAAELPPTAAPDMRVYALDDPALEIDENDVHAGASLFAACGACHGLNLHAAGTPGPDLRESAVALDPDALWSVVNEGTLIEFGMPPFKHLTKEQVRQIYVYIRAGAREAIAANQESEPQTE
jgi:quinohemoprotein ethanol dehydrogenase